MEANWDGPYAVLPIDRAHSGSIRPPNFLSTHAGSAASTKGLVGPFEPLPNHWSSPSVGAADDEAVRERMAASSVHTVGVTSTISYPHAMRLSAIRD